MLVVVRGPPQRTIANAWRRAAEWMREAQHLEWDKLRTQDWKEAVPECTGVRESGGEEWRMDEKDRWNLGPIKQYEVEKRKFIEGCYGPIPTGL